MCYWRGRGVGHVSSVVRFGSHDPVGRLPPSHQRAGQLPAAFFNFDRCSVLVDRVRQQCSGQLAHTIMFYLCL